MSKTETEVEDEPGEVLDDTATPGYILRHRLGIMTPMELAGALGVHVGTLKQWRYRGVGPDYTVAERRVYYRYADVIQYLALHVRQAKQGGAF